MSVDCLAKSLRRLIDKCFTFYDEDTNSHHCRSVMLGRLGSDVFLSPPLQWYVKESLFYDIIIPKHLKNIYLPSKVKREDSSGTPRWLNKSKDFQTKRKWCFEKKIVRLIYLKKMHSPVGEEEEAHFYFHPVKAERATSNNFLLTSSDKYFL